DPGGGRQGGEVVEAAGRREGGGEVVGRGGDRLLDEAVDASGGALERRDVELAGLVLAEAGDVAGRGRERGVGGGLDAGAEAVQGRDDVVGVEVGPVPGGHRGPPVDEAAGDREALR